MDTTPDTTLPEFPALPAADAAAADGPGPDAPAANFAKDERGQISILLMFGTITLVLLAGVIFNTAKVSIRKVEMQNAADAGALASAAWVARGMNLIAFNNCGMGDVMAIMVTVRAFLETAQIMSQFVLPPLIAALYAGVFTAGVAAYLNSWELPYWIWLRSTFEGFDATLNTHDSGLWLALTGMDKLNQGIKVGFGVLAAGQTANLAAANGAQIGFVIPGEGAGAAGFTAPVPVLPVGRGDNKLIAKRGFETCVWGPIQLLPAALIIAAPVTAVGAFAIYAIMFTLNWNSLGGLQNGHDDGQAANNPSNNGTNAQGLQYFRDNHDKAMELIREDRNNGGAQLMSWLNQHPDIKQQFTRPADANHPDEWIDLDAFVTWLDGHNEEAAQIAAQMQEQQATQQANQAINQGGGGGGGGGPVKPPLTWPSDPPRPMVLNSDPDMTSMDEKVTGTTDLKKVYKYLQYLAIAQAPMEQSVIAPTRMTNPANALGSWLTYGQANTYNPTRWDTYGNDNQYDMFSQDWRCKLVKAKLLNEKLDKIPLFDAGQSGIGDAANTH